MYLLDFNIFTLFMELSLVVSIVSFAIAGWVTAKVLNKEQLLP